jgi:hypothetical protein
MTKCEDGPSRSTRTFFAPSAVTRISCIRTESLFNCAIRAGSRSCVPSSSRMTTLAPSLRQTMSTTRSSLRKAVVCLRSVDTISPSRRRRSLKKENPSSLAALSSASISAPSKSGPARAESAIEYAFAPQAVMHTAIASNVRRMSPSYCPGSAPATACPIEPLVVACRVQGMRLVPCWLWGARGVVAGAAGAPAQAQAEGRSAPEKER